MEYCDGMDLRQLIDKHNKEKKPINEILIYNIVLDICLGIKEIHKKNIIHRDLNPKNIFKLKNNKIKIGDFGISKQLDKNKKYASTQAGTFEYNPPEFFKKKYTNKIDIWSFGCIIYELLTLNYCFENICDIINYDGKYGKIDTNIYNSKWQDLIDLLLKKDYNERPNIDDVYNFLKKELTNITQKLIKIRISNDEILKIEKQGKNITYLNSKKQYTIIYFII